MQTASFISRDPAVQLAAIQAVHRPYGADNARTPAPQKLTSEEKKEVSRLKQLDTEVKRHEEAHYRAAGPHALSPPSYDYAKGPDGKRYRVGGEVQIDTSKEPDPEATIEKAEIVKRAALAPVDPSAQDRRIAALADRMIQEAELELRRHQTNDATRESTAEGSSSRASSPKHHTDASTALYLDLKA
jgi:hypothetical protein